MIERTEIVGVVELIGAVAIGTATFILGGFADHPLPWRILAVFMGAEGFRRVRSAGDNRFTASDDC